MRKKSGPARVQSFVAALLLTASTVFFLPSTALGQDVWEERNDRGNRFEGRRDVTVKRPDLELVSFVGFYEDFYAEDVELKVQFYLDDDKPVRLVARELEERSQYWMEAKPWTSNGGSWNEWGPWRTGDVLRREGIPSSNLGVVVRVEGESEGGSEGLAPAFVYYSQPPKSVRAYTIHIRPNAALRGASYRLVRADGTLIDGADAAVADFAGEPFRIRLDVADEPDGLLRLEIETEIDGRNKIAKRSYEFYHQSDLPDERLN